MARESRIVSNISWSFAERLLAQGVGLVVTMVLARLLAPEHYGTIALVTVYITICNVFITNGPGVSLIQDKNADQTDFSTVFYMSLALGVGLYLLMYFAAPYIADYYNNAILIPVIRVMSLRLPIASVSTIQRAHISRHMQFKKLFFSTLGSTVASGAIGVLLALRGYGVWALVAQELLRELVITVVLFFVVDWRPKWLFSGQCAKKHFVYSWKVTVSELLANIFAQIRTVVIGKKYTVEDVAYYNQGQKYPDYVISSVSTSICAVLFPAIANHIDDMAQVKALTRKAIKTSAFLLVPMMVGLAVTAVPFITLLFSEKWLPCVPYMRIICVIYIMMPINSISIQAIKAIGRSDAILKTRVLKTIFSLIVLLAALPYGIMALAYSSILDNVITSLINMYPCKKYIGYRYTEQLTDVLPAVLLSAGMAAAVLLASRLPIPSLLLSFAVQILVGIAAYAGLALLFRSESMRYILAVIKNRLRKDDTHETV